MSEDIGVRIGGPEDVHPMMELALQACEENGFVDPNPHKMETAMPNTAIFADLLTTWVPDEATRKRILVDNPARLYGFK